MNTTDNFLQTTTASIITLETTEPMNGPSAKNNQTTFKRLTLKQFLNLNETNLNINITTLNNNQVNNSIDLLSSDSFMKKHNHLIIKNDDGKNDNNNNITIEKEFENSKIENATANLEIAIEINDNETLINDDITTPSITTTTTITTELETDSSTSTAINPSTTTIPSTTDPSDPGTNPSTNTVSNGPTTNEPTTNEPTTNEPSTSDTTDYTTANSNLSLPEITTISTSTQANTKLSSELILNSTIESLTSTTSKSVITNNNINANDNVGVDVVSVQPIFTSNLSQIQSTSSQTQSRSNEKLLKNCYIEEHELISLELHSNSKSDYENINTLKSNFSNSLYKIVCYFTNWSRRRPNSGRFLPKLIDPFLCTHINYAFARLNNETLLMEPSDSCTDIENKYYYQVTSLKRKNPKLKVLISLGGWLDSGESDKYSRLVSNSTARKLFIKNAISFLMKYNFDGLDLDWEFPKCWQGACNSGPDIDRQNFVALIKELRREFSKHPIPLLLTAAVSANKLIIDSAYDSQELAQNLDFVNLMSYDYNGIGSPNALHHSPLVQHPKFSDDKYSNVNFTIDYWLNEKHFPAYKMILGIPFYGRSFQLKSGSEGSMGSEVVGPGQPGVFTNENGVLSYFEICNLIMDHRWAKRSDSYSFKNYKYMSEPYAQHSNQWVGYDDKFQLMKKSQLIKSMSLGGAMIWSLDQDDFNGSCCSVKYPLLKTLNHQLRSYDFDLNYYCP